MNPARQEIISDTDHRYLLIAGAPKAATTSLFRYLADHPEVCQANRKETYFFAREFDDKNLCTVDETLESFQTYFAHCNSRDKLRIEATPYTLYTENAATKIAEMLPNSRIVVLLRDPVRRLFSDFLYQKQRMIPEVQNKSFGEYASMLIHHQGDRLNQLAIGRYIDYLNPFYDLFPKSHVLVLFYEDLKANLATTMKNLCLQLAIDPEFYTDYAFDIHNKTISVRYEWLNQMRMNLEPRVASVRKIAIRNQTAHRAFEKIVDAGRSTIRHINDQKEERREVLTFDDHTMLLAYYQPFNQKLEKKLERPLPIEWNPPHLQGITYNSLDLTSNIGAPSLDPTYGRR